MDPVPTKTDLVWLFSQGLSQSRFSNGMRCRWRWKAYGKAGVVVLPSSATTAAAALACIGSPTGTTTAAGRPFPAGAATRRGRCSGHGAPPRHLVTPGDEPPAVLLRSAESPPGISWTADGGRLLCFEPLTAELWFFYYSLFSRMEEADLLFGMLPWPSLVCWFGVSLWQILYVPIIFWKNFATVAGDFPPYLPNYHLFLPWFIP